MSYLKNLFESEVNSVGFTNTKESGLESYIAKWLVEHNGYEEGFQR